jgi:hypothetical protein
VSNVKIRACDEGTAFAAALIAEHEAAAANATDVQSMAAFCEHIMPLMVGAFSPRLVWEGAQKRGMTTLELHKLCHDKDLRAIDDLQWDD